MNHPQDDGVDHSYIRCYPDNNQPVSWPNPAFQPECAACHEVNYHSYPHAKHLSPNTSYSASELRDCAGSCQFYIDSSLTVISETRNAQHRVSDPQF